MADGAPAGWPRWPTIPLSVPLYCHHHTPPGAVDAVMTISKTEGLLALYRGLVPTLLGVAPYAAINFATYDLAKKWLYHGERCVG